MKQIVLGTTSPDKLREMQALLADVDVQWLPLTCLGQPPAVEETGATFSENARLKALALARWCGRPVLADDSGLEVDALDGAPGVASRRFAGPEASDDDRNAKLLQALDGVPVERRGAQYVCALVLAFNGRVLIEVQGRLRGRIAEAPAGTAGFGYDPLFIPEGFDRAIGELGEAVKHRISHRARAAQAFKRRFVELGRRADPPGGAGTGAPTSGQPH